MPQPMFFGNENHMQWVPMPATGMSVSRASNVERLGFQNGRQEIHRSSAFSKTFTCDFPVQEATGLTGIDIFSKYASGFYGSNDEFPLYFANPMHYESNLMPEHWASPGLVGEGWPALIDMSTTSRFNLAVNPSAEVNLNNWSSVSGTGGTAALSRVSSTAFGSGSFAARVTWSVATTAISGAIAYLGTPVQAGHYYAAQMRVIPSVTQRLRVNVQYRNSIGSSLGGYATAGQVFSAGVMASAGITGTPAPAGAVTMDVYVEATTGTSAVNWAATNTLTGDSVMINEGLAPWPYFDGSFPGALWQGSAHNSASYQFVQQPTVQTPLTNMATNTTNLPKKKAQYTLSGLTAFTPGQPFVIIPIPPTHTLWLGSTGTTTNDGQLYYRAYSTQGAGSNNGTDTAIVLSAENSTTRLSNSISGASWEYVKIWVGGSGTLTLQSITARLYRTGVFPTATGNFFEGQGHTGLKFEDDANTENYVQVDLYRNVPVHYKGLNTKLTETG